MASDNLVSITINDKSLRRSLRALDLAATDLELTAVKHGNCSSLTPLLNPVRTRKSLIWP